MTKYKDFYWLNNHSRLFLSRGYISPDSLAEDRLKQIADNAESYLKIDGFSEKFLGYLARGFYSLSTPVWNNYGNKKGLPVSCFNSHIPDDTVGIFDKVGEVAIMSKMGGGTSAYFGDVRPRGSKIGTDGGQTDGPVRFMELFDKTADVISQGSARRGSFAAYLPVTHPDIEEFLRVRSEGNAIQNMSIGVTIPNAWMNDMRNGDKPKRKIWGEIIKKRFESGYPYIFFTDNINDNAPQVYKDKGLTVNSSNLCVSGETQILTRDGYKDIKGLAGTNVEVWNGRRWSVARCEKTGADQELIRVFVNQSDDKFNSLVCSLWVTPSHKFYLHDGSEISARDLRTDHVLLDLKLPQDKRFSFTTSTIRSTVICISSDVKTADTYCVNEPLEHKVVFNGVLTGNCSEIALASDINNSFVCVLSSLNLLHWDEIVQTDAIETLIYFLDTVNQEFVDKTENMPYMEAAHNFAKTQRALGMGVLGWHSFLQSKDIAFESFEAKLLNSSIWKTIRQRADNATKQLADMFGEPELLKGYGRRNVTTLAVAPTTSSSFILGQVSPSIEPLDSNYFVKKLAKGSFTYKNPYLRHILKELGRDDDDTWRDILNHGGSVQHCDYLTDHQRAVFKTFGEISQKEVVIQAIQRQPHIDQSQSLNVKISHDTKPKESSDLLIYGWENGIKTFYYQRGTNPAQQLARSILTCTSCEA